MVEIINPLSVSIQSSGKKRLILDLRYINHHIWKHKIIFDDCSIALQYFIGGGFMFSFDLKSGYHHIDIFPDQVLPFGLSSGTIHFYEVYKTTCETLEREGIFYSGLFR